MPDELIEPLDQPKPEHAPQPSATAGSASFSKTQELVDIEAMTNFMQQVKVSDLNDRAGVMAEKDNSPIALSYENGNETTFRRP